MVVSCSVAICSTNCIGIQLHWRYTWYDEIILEFTEVSPAEWPCQGSVVPLGPIAPVLAPVLQEDVTVSTCHAVGGGNQLSSQILPAQSIAIKSCQNLQFWTKLLSGVIHSWNQWRTSYQKFCPNKLAIFCLVGLGPLSSRMWHGFWKPGPSQAW